MSTDIWVFVEQHAGVAAEASLGVVTEAARLAPAASAQVVAVLAGPGASQAAVAAGSAGATAALVVPDEAYATYSTEAYTHALATLVVAHAPAALLFAATTYGADLAPRLAARLDTGLVSDATALWLDADGRFTFTKNTLGGNLLTQCRIAGDTQLGTVRTGLYKKAEVGGTAEVSVEDVTAPAVRTTLLEVVDEAGSGELALEDADVVISGGRAMGGAEGFGILRDLAAAFGPTAAVGASRPAADAGWVPTHQEIGVSGKTVSPDLYVACGISGASQHLAGMSSSRTILAINSDPDAPIFDVADLAVVGDLFEIVPALTAAVAAARA